jgi:hypothetical protein
VDEQSERPATSVCKVRTSYGPFYEVDNDAVAAGELDRDHMCEKCVESARDRPRDTAYDRYQAEQEQDDADDTEGDA